MSPTITGTATPTTTPPPTAGGDSYEPDDTCALARIIPTDGTIQERTLHKSTDEDWIAFQAIAGTRYLIFGQVPADSPADLALTSYNRCDGLPGPGQNKSFSPDVRLEFQAAVSGPVFLRLVNHSVAVADPHVRYSISVRELEDEPQVGAVIIVAGRLTESDPLQAHIHQVTDRVYRLFESHRYTDDRIYYLATDYALPGFDAPATRNNLRAAIKDWAAERVGADQPLSLYLIDHGNPGVLYLDKPRGEWVIPGELDSWLSQLEAARPGLKINVFIEACYSGSFINLAQSVSKPGRVVIASTDATNPAYASDRGALFSDHFLDSLARGQSLYQGFRSATDAVRAVYRYQTPWLDDNGNGIPNEPGDGQQAQRRGFTFTGTLSDEQWPPYIAEATSSTSVRNGHGIIQARVLDDQRVHRAWAVIYPPSYQPPVPGEQLVQETLPTIVLLDQGGSWYGATYPGFTERGTYRVVIYAEDGEGLEARPVAISISTGQQVHLPLVLR